MHSRNTHTGADPKDTAYRNPKYLQFIDTKPCVVCSRKATHHHENLCGKGTALKCSDYECLPLCLECHNKRHDQGKYTFWGDHFFSTGSICDDLQPVTESDIDFCLGKIMLGYLTEYLEKCRK